MTSFLSRVAFLGLSSVCVFGLGACRDLPRVTHENVASSVSPKLTTHPPIDVAIAPIVNRAGADVPADDLRAAFHRNLVTRRYSPLALAFVDKNVVDAAYRPGASSEEAVLVVEVDRWDTSLWSTHNAILAKVTARLVDAADPSGAELGSWRIDERVTFGAESTHFSTETARLAWACDQIAGRLLEALPVRPARP